MLVFHSENTCEVIAALSFSHTLAVVILFLALGTWFFDKELKRKEARCASICDSFTGASLNTDSSYETNTDSVNSTASRYQNSGGTLLDEGSRGGDANDTESSQNFTPPQSGRGRWGHHTIGKCECDTAGE